jgi:hypothetical protein
LVLILSMSTNGYAQKAEAPKATQTAEAPKTAMAASKPLTDDGTQAAAAETQAPRVESVHVSVGIQLNMLAVSDDDPANDRVLLYALNASVDLPIKGLVVSLSGGFAERFVVEDGDSPLRLNDSAMGVSYSHAHLSKEKLSFSHGLTAWLPTSRPSLQRELRVAPNLSSSVAYRIVGPLSISHQIQGQYRWYRYAEVPNGLAMNTQWIIGERVGLILRALDSPTFGKLAISTGVGLRWSRKYASLDPHTTDSADQALWSQSYSWRFGLQYRPIKWVGLSTNVEHGSPLRRNGIINPFFAHRDMTEINFGVTGYY